MVRGRRKSGDVDHRSEPGSTVEGFGEKPSDFPCLALTRMTSSMVIGLMQSNPHLLAEPEERTAGENGSIAGLDNAGGSVGNKMGYAV